MRSELTQAHYIKDPENYSELQVCQSAAGYYIGTMYKDPKTGWEEPGSRDSGYYRTRIESPGASAKYFYKSNFFTMLGSTK